MKRQYFLSIFVSVVCFYLFNLVIPDLQFFINNGFSRSISNHNAFASIVNGPIITRYSNDISGRNVFKATVELAGLSKHIGLINACIYSDSPIKMQTDIQSLKPNICHVSNVTQEYLHYFPNDHCPSCIVPIGTVVFPQSDVHNGTKVTACITLVTTKITTCNHIINRYPSHNENILITLP